MFAKLCVIITAAGLCGANLLTLRHERMQAQSELMQCQLRIKQQDERLWMLRARIAARITPPSIQSLTAGMIELHPITPTQALTTAQLAELIDTSVIVGPPSRLQRPYAKGNEPLDVTTLAKASGTRDPQAAQNKPGAKSGSKPKPATNAAGKSKADTKGKTTKPSGNSPAKKNDPKATPAKKTSPTRIARSEEPPVQEESLASHEGEE